jgi:hypothetical protein
LIAEKSLAMTITALAIAKSASQVERSIGVFRCVSASIGAA